MADRDQLEGRNVVIEALRRQRRRVRELLLDERARPGGKIDELLALAREQGVPVKRLPREQLDRRSLTGAHNGVIALADPLEAHTTHSLLGELDRRGVDPFLVLVDEVQYEHNLGAILRSAMGAAVDGVIVPVQRGKGISPVVSRVAMGGAEVVPLVREGLSSALATIRRAGVLVVGCDMDGEPIWDLPLGGPLALVLGGEDKGLSPTLRARCDRIGAVPLAAGLDSLNLSVTAALFMFERVRQRRLAEAAAQRQGPAGG